MGTGLGHYIPLVAYLGFWVMTLLSLTGRPLLGFYYLIPFLPYRTMRDHFLAYPLGANTLTVLLLAVIVGAIIKGKRLPSSKLYIIWLIFGIYLYFSMWMGTAMGNAPAPLWLSDLNFVTWKDYMVIPLVFVAGSLVLEDRKSIRTSIILIAIALTAIDRSSLLESLSRSWANYDESKRSGGPLGYGSNQTAAFLADYGMFFWGVGQFLKRWKLKFLSYTLVAITILATMYTFSRGAYLAILFAVLVLALVNDRKLLIVLGVFLLTWQTIVPTPVRERVNMTHTADGQLENSAQERVDLWENAERSFMHSPIVGNGYATFQMGEHVDNLKDTHNWYVKVLVETGIIGFIFVLGILQQLLSTAYRLFKRSSDPLYKGLGLGLLMATCSSIVANLFGDRWTYLEISGLLFVLAAAAVRASELQNSSAPDEGKTVAVAQPVNPYMAYR